MKLTVKECLEISEVLAALKNGNSLNFDISWTFEDIINELSKHVQRYQEQQNELLKEYGTADEKREGFFNIQSENIEVYKSKIEAVSNFEVDVNLTSINIEDLKGLKVPANIQTHVLNPIINRK